MGTLLKEGLRIGDQLLTDGDVPPSVAQTYYDRMAEMGDTDPKIPGRPSAQTPDTGSESWLSRRKSELSTSMNVLRPSMARRS